MLKTTLAFRRVAGTLVLAATLATSAAADEALFGMVKGAEPLPRHASELYVMSNVRAGKSVGTYRGINTDVEYERGFTDRLTASAALRTQSIKTEGLRVNAYIPLDEQYGPRFSGLEASLKYNFLKTAMDPVGLSLYTTFELGTLDPHSGQKKTTLSMEQRLLLQKYFRDASVIWVVNVGLESTIAKRYALDGLAADFEWPTQAEMEISPRVGTGLSWRFAPNWYAGAEVFYEAEYETEVELERWSLFAGPSLHYGSRRWWGTLTWLPQLRGGGEAFDGQQAHLHLIEKTKNEYRIKVGYNF